MINNNELNKDMLYDEIKYSSLDDIFFKKKYIMYKKKYLINKNLIIEQKAGFDYQTYVYAATALGVTATTLGYYLWNNKKEEEKDDEDPECEIINCNMCLSCINNNDDVLMCSRYDVFHTSCLKPWLNIKNICPVCYITIDNTKLKSFALKDYNRIKYKDLKEALKKDNTDRNLEIFNKSVLDNQIIIEKQKKKKEEEFNKFLKDKLEIKRKRIADTEKEIKIREDLERKRKIESN